METQGRYRCKCGVRVTVTWSFDAPPPCHGCVDCGHQMVLEFTLNKKLESHAFIDDDIAIAEHIMIRTRICKTCGMVDQEQMNIRDI